MEEEMAEI